jgi:type II secretory pathway component GspD/PulD (secretin)
LRLGSPRWYRSIPLALPLWAGLASSAYAQRAPPGTVDMPVTRLQGSGTAADSGGVIRQTPQPRPGDLSALPLTHLDERGPSADLDGPRRVALSLARPLPLRDMLLLLVNGTPLSIVTDDSVDGTFIGDLKDLTMRQALEAVLFPRGLDYDLQGSLIRVFAHKPATRLFDVHFVNQRRSWQRGLRSTTTVGGARTAETEVVTTGVSDAFEDLADGVRSLLSNTGRLHIDRSAGLVQVTDFAERLDHVAVYVEAVQLRASRQVRIDARVFEVTLTDPAARSIDWKAAGVLTGAGRSTAGMTIVDTAAFMTAIAAQGVITMIAAPQIVATNNETAVMRVGTQNVYFESVSHLDENGRPQRSSSAASVLEGLTLTVTPQIAGDGAVQLSVAPTYSEKMGQAKSAAGDIYPLLHVSEADTVVRVRDGDTVIIAGFLRDRSVSKPGTGLASYFGAQTHAVVKSELVVLLTPVVVTPGGTSVTSRR